MSGIFFANQNVYTANLHDAVYELVMLSLGIFIFWTFLKYL